MLAVTYPPRRPKVSPPKWTVHFATGRRVVDWIQTADAEYALDRARRRFPPLPCVVGVSTFDRDYAPPT